MYNKKITVSTERRNSTIHFLQTGCVHPPGYAIEGYGTGGVKEGEHARL